MAELDQEGHTAQYVLIGRVISLLDPEHKLATPPPPPDPRADPLLGTLPVTAPAPEPPPEPPQPRRSGGE